MKAPKAQLYPDVPTESMQKTAKLPPVAVKNKTPKKTPTPEAAVRRSYTLNKTTDDIINTVALKMTQKRRKPVSASEALRSIIEAYKVQS